MIIVSIENFGNLRTYNPSSFFNVLKEDNFSLDTVKNTWFCKCLSNLISAILISVNVKCNSFRSVLGKYGILADSCIPWLSASFFLSIIFLRFAKNLFIHAKNRKSLL